MDEKEGEEEEVWSLQLLQSLKVPLHVNCGLLLYTEAHQDNFTCARLGVPVLQMSSLG